MIFWIKWQKPLKPLLHNDFIETTITAKKKYASHNRAFREVEFGPFRRLRQMNGTRLKLFQSTRRPEQKVRHPGSQGLRSWWPSPRCSLSKAVRAATFFCATASTMTRAHDTNINVIPLKNRSRIASMQIDEQCGEYVRCMHGMTTRCTSAFARTNERLDTPRRSLPRKQHRPHWAAGIVTPRRKTQWSSFSTSSS